MINRRQKLKEHRPSSNVVNTTGKLIHYQYMIVLNSHAEPPTSYTNLWLEVIRV